ncbi:MAG: cell division protein FtsZ [Janthinobacterium lividum]
MNAYSINKPPHLIELRPKITVVGVGGAGGNAVDNMIRSNLQGVEFVVCNTDAQALGQAATEHRIQLGHQVTQGLGAGSRPEVGRAAAEESIEQILKQIEGSNMVFVTAGMGGGTGTGAAPVIAQAAREQGILTVAVVTKPFNFEGNQRMRKAETGILELQQYVDTLIIIPNQNLFRIVNEKTTFADAFRLADDVLHAGVRGVTDLMMIPGLINLDFADVRAVMMEMGKAMMGTGEASDENRAIAAAEAAISNPLLDDVSMKGAQAVLINITGGMDMTLFEVDEAANRVREEVDPDANIILGSTFDENMQGRIRVSVVATGIAMEGAQKKTSAQMEAGRANDFSKASSPMTESVTPRGFFTRKREEEKTAEDEENDLFSANYRPTQNAADHTLSQEQEQGQVQPQAPETAPSYLQNSKPVTQAPMMPEEQFENPVSFSQHKTRKLGFFERVAETVRGARSQQEENLKPANYVPSHTNEEEVKIYTDMKERANSQEQDALEIPAFLRRRANNK